MPKLNLKPNCLLLGPTSNYLVWANFQITQCGPTSKCPMYFNSIAARLYQFLDKFSKNPVQPRGYTIFREIFKNPSIAARLYPRNVFCLKVRPTKKKKKNTAQPLYSRVQPCGYTMKENFKKTPARVVMNRFLLFPQAILPYYQAYE